MVVEEHNIKTSTTSTILPTQSPRVAPRKTWVKPNNNIAEKRYSLQPNSTKGTHIYDGKGKKLFMDKLLRGPTGATIWEKVLSNEWVGWHKETSMGSRLRTH